MRPLILALLALLVVKASPLSAQYERERPGHAMVVIENHNWSDVVVYAVRGATRMRLGTVTAIHKNTFYVPPTMLHDGTLVRLYIRPIGGPSRGAPFYQSEGVHVRSDEKAVVTLDVDLARSFIGVWVR